MMDTAEETRLAEEREAMVERHLVRRGIYDEAVLEAMRTVPREAFVPEDMAEFAYADAPLPIGEGQTISQPYTVALMTEELELEGGERVLDVGTGSGYAAAVLSRIAGEVYTVERHASLVQGAEERFRQLGYDSIHVRHGDGTLGWPEEAPFDAIAVAAAGPEVPEPLLEQLAVGGWLVMPTGPAERLQKLVRVWRTSEEDYEREDLGGVQFVPLIGAAGFKEPETNGTNPEEARAQTGPATLPERIARAAEPFPSVEEADVSRLLERIGDARVVLLGEATHGRVLRDAREDHAGAD